MFFLTKVICLSAVINVWSIYQEYLGLPLRRSANGRVELRTSLMFLTFLTFLTNKTLEFSMIRHLLSSSQCIFNLFLAYTPSLKENNMIFPLPHFLITHMWEDEDSTYRVLSGTGPFNSGYLHPTAPGPCRDVWCYDRVWTDDCVPSIEKYKPVLSPFE